MIGPAGETNGVRHFSRTEDRRAGAPREVWITPTFWSLCHAPGRRNALVTNTRAVAASPDPPSEPHSEEE
jgi:hypothetical protein